MNFDQLAFEPLVYSFCKKQLTPKGFIYLGLDDKPLTNEMPTYFMCAHYAFFKLLKLEENGETVTTELFIKLAWAVRNRDAKFISCRNTLKAVLQWIEKTYETN